MEYLHTIHVLNIVYDSYKVNLKEISATNGFRLHSTYTYT